MTILNHKNREEYTYYVLLYLKKGLKDEFRADFLALHPMDQIDIFMTLQPELRERVLFYLTLGEFAEIFKHLEVKEQKKVIKGLDHTAAVQLLSEMFSDDIVDFLGELEPELAEELLNSLGTEDAQELKTLLAYRPDTAGAMMTVEYIAALKHHTAGEVMKRLQVEGIEAETIYYIYVINELEQLVGVVSLRDLIISPQERMLEELMKKQPITISPSTPYLKISELIKKYDFLALPVVTQQGKLEGIVTVDDVLDTMENEANDNLEAMGTVRGAVDLEISAWEASKKRLPWLILLLFLGLLTAGVIGQFEETLMQIAVLAIFIPVIADMAGNTGTQSLAVVVRGMALGKLDLMKVGRLIKREFFVGLIMGIVCAIVVACISLFVTTANIMLGFVIGFSLFCTVVISTLTGTIVPIIVNKLRIDPAVASGPFITTINDIIGLMIYFSVAAAILL